MEKKCPTVSTPVLRSYNEVHSLPAHRGRLVVEAFNLWPAGSVFDFLKERGARRRRERKRKRKRVWLSSATWLCTAWFKFGKKKKKRLIWEFHGSEFWPILELRFPNFIFSASVQFHFSRETPHEWTLYRKKKKKKKKSALHAGKLRHPLYSTVLRILILKPTTL